MDVGGRQGEFGQPIESRQIPLYGVPVIGLELGDQSRQCCGALVTSACD
jgi:hypothetical protein